MDVGEEVGRAIGQQVQRHLHNIERRRLRDVSNPFAIPEATFKRLYRIPQGVALHLLGTLEPHMRDTERITRIRPHLQLLCALHFFAQGSYQKSVGQDFVAPLSQSSVSRCISDISVLITNHLSRQYIKFPQTREEIARVKLRFMQQFQFPGVVGCIDCTHIAIVAPPIDHPIHPGYTYINRKGYHSVNVQLICDSQLRILNANANFPGSTHDAAIWTMSQVQAQLQEAYEHGEHGTWLLGDSGYPLQPWLLTPIEGVPNPATPAGRYSAAHIRTRNVIERTNGLLKSRFRCLLRHRALHYAPPNAAYIIYACCTLHNILVAANDLEVYVEELEDGLDMQDDNVAVDEVLPAGRRVRDDVIRQHFTL